MPIAIVLLSVALTQSIFADAPASSLRGVAQAVSSNTIVLDVNVREKVMEESVPLAFFSSEKVGLSFVIR